MGAISINGSLTIGPSSGGSVFPASSGSIPLETTPSPKTSGADSGVRKQQLNSALSFVDLHVAGDGEAVTQGDTLYFRSDSPVDLRLTFAQPSAPDLISTLEVQGLVVLETPPDRYLKQVEAQGIASIEYLVSGQV